ncbi:MAG: BON domain-containing protein [Myxococcota bacterium]|nr:BON domain-containing protein [Myxococcota bacterium]
MRSDKGRVPQSYDEIVRKTVPDLDSSERPTVRQEQDAREGFRAMDEHEQALASRVLSALGGMTGVDVEVDRETVTLRGKVADATQISRAEELVSQVDGVSGVMNHLVVGS